MADKSIPQLNPVTTIEDADLYHVVRSNVDYKITGEDLVKAIKPYYEYSALISQLAAATITSGALNVGQLYTLTTYVSGDDFSNQLLVSGTVNTTGSTFIAIDDTPTDYSNGSTLDTGAEPFVVSLDVNGYPNPLVNTFPVAVTLTRTGVGSYLVNIAHTSLQLQGFIGHSAIPIIPQLYNTYNDTGLVLETYDFSFALADELLENTPIKIFGYY